MRINDEWAPHSLSLSFSFSPFLSLSRAQQDSLSRCPCRSRPRSAVSLRPHRFFSLSFTVTRLPRTLLPPLVPLSSLFLFSSSSFSFLPVSRAHSRVSYNGYLPRIRRGWVEGEGGIFTSRARRGRNTHTCTHARTEIRRREGESGRADDEGGRGEGRVAAER